MFVSPGAVVPDALYSSIYAKREEITRSSAPRFAVLLIVILVFRQVTVFSTVVRCVV